MTVADLITKMEAINDKTVEVMFFCRECGKYIPLDDMKSFGFQVPLNFGQESV